MSEAAITTTAVSARYGPEEDAVLTDVTLDVAAGEILAILGANGAGKSTLLRVLAGTLTPTHGDVTLFGAPLRGQTRGDVARQVAFVAQSEEVGFSFSVREVVLMGRAPHQGTSMRASQQDERIVDALLASSDLAHLAHRSVAELSGGERKRVSIARAYAQSTPLLLLDEPTASLDLPHQVRLFDQLAKRAHVDGRQTVVVVTHDLQLAAAHATRVALFKAGRLLAIGSVEDVMTAERLAEAFDWPIDAGVLAGTTSRVFVPRSTPGTN